MSFFELTNGKKFDINNIKAGIKIDENNEFLKKYDVNNNSIFENSELDKFKEDLKQYTDDGKVDKEEYANWYAKVIGMTVDAVKNLFNTGEKKEDDIEKLFNSSFNELEEAEAHRECIEIIRNTALKANTDMMLDDRESITKLFNKLWNFFGDKLSENQIYRLIFEELMTAEFLDEAEQGELTKSEYIERKIENTKALCMAKIMKENLEDVKKWTKEHGITNWNEEKFVRYMDAYLDCNLRRLVKEGAEKADGKIDCEEAAEILKQWVDNILSMDEEKGKKFFTNMCTNACEKANDTNNWGLDGKYIQSLGDDSLSFDDTEKLTFNQVFKLERGEDFSVENFHAFKKAESNMQIVSGAYNKLSLTLADIDGLMQEYNEARINHDELGDDFNYTSKTPDASKRIPNIIRMFAKYYMGDAELAADDLNKMIEEYKNIATSNNIVNGLKITAEDDGSLSIEFDESLDSDMKRNMALNNLLEVFKSEISKRFEKILGDKKLDDYINEFNSTRDKAIGGTDLDGVISAFQNREATAIDNVAGVAQTGGMVLIVAGGILCLTPAAATGIPEAMTALGGNIVVGTMVLEYEAKYLEYAEKFIKGEEIDEEELNNLNKHFIMDAGGMIVGIKAGKLGNKVFGKLLDKKLAQVLEKPLSEVNRIKDFKNIIGDKALLKNLMQAFGGKVITDFLISYAGDLAMMGALGGVEGEDALTLLRANLMGIAIGTTSDLADLGNIGIRRERLKELRDKHAKGELTNPKDISELAALEKEFAEIDKPEMGLIDEPTKADLSLTDAEITKLLPEYEGKEVKVTKRRDKHDNSTSEEKRVNGKVVQRIYTYKDGETRIENYSSDGKLKSVIRKNAKGSRINALYYNKNGDIASEIMTDSKTGKVIITTENFYDDKGILIKDEYIHGDHKSVTEYKYDDNSNCIEAKSTHSDGKVSITTKSYDSNNRLIKSVRKDNGEIIETRDYTYDKNGNKIKEIGTNPRYTEIYTLTKEGAIEYIAELKNKIGEMQNDSFKKLLLDEIDKIDLNNINKEEFTAIEKEIKALKEFEYKLEPITDPEMRKYIDDELSGKNQENDSEVPESIGHKIHRLNELVDAYNEMNGVYVKTEGSKSLKLRNFIYDDLAEKILPKDIDSDIKNEFIRILQNLVEKDVDLTSPKELRKKIMSLDLKKEIKNIKEQIQNSGRKLTETDKKRLENLDKILDNIGIFTNPKIKTYLIKYTNPTLLKDFEEDMRIGSLVDYCKCNPNSEMGTKLYNKYLEDLDISPEFKQRISDINTKYNTKTFLSKSQISEGTIKFIETELAEWDRAGGDQVKYPPVLEMLKAKDSYYNRCCGIFGSVAGFSEVVSGAISINGNGYMNLALTLRHEMTHTNDLTRQGFEEADFDDIKSKKKYILEFLKVGIDPDSVAYAYTNPAEFIAVASQGDMSKYSPEFKEVLVSLGMPRWMFDMQPNPYCKWIVVDVDPKTASSSVDETNSPKAKKPDMRVTEKSKETSAKPENTRIETGKNSNIATEGISAGTKYTVISENIGITFDAAKNKYIIDEERLQSIETFINKKMDGDAFSTKKCMENLVRTLTQDDITNIDNMLNSLDITTSKRLLENPDELLVLYSNLKNSSFFKYGEISDSEWQVVQNLLDNPIQNDDLASLMRYKGTGYKNINQAMVDAELNGTQIPEHLQIEIDNIERIIATQTINKPLTVYRTDSMNALDKVVVNFNGSEMPLSEALQKCNSESDIAKVTEYINNNNCAFTNEHFTSTSMFAYKKVGTNDDVKLVWELEVQPDAQGMYVEGVNYGGKLCREREFIIQSHANIEITKIEQGADGLWHIKAKVTTPRNGVTYVNKLGMGLTEKPESNAKATDNRKIESRFDLDKTSYETYTDKNGNKIYKVVAAATPNEKHGGYDFTYDVYKVDSDGNIIDEIKGVNDKEIKEKFGRLKDREIHDNSGSDNSGYAYSGVPFFSRVWNTVTGKTEAPEEPSGRRKTNLDSNEPDLYTDNPLSVDAIRQILTEVCDELTKSTKSNFFSDIRTIANRFLAGVYTGSVIFKDKNALREYLVHCYNMTGLTNEDGQYIFKKKVYDNSTNQIIRNWDDSLIKDVATLMVTDERIHESLGNLVSMLMSNDIDEFSFKTMVHYVKKGYLSPGTIDTALKSLITTDGKKNVGMYYVEFLADTTPNKTDIKDRQRILVLLENSNPEVKNAITNLKQEIGDEIYNLRWECVNGRDTDAQTVLDFVKDAKNLLFINKTMLMSENFQIKIQGYPQNQVWLHDIPEIANVASTMLDEGNSFDDVMSFIAMSYRDLDAKVINKKDDEYKLQASGMLRCQRGGYMYYQDEKGYKTHYERGSVTRFGTNDCYGINYYNRFMQHTKANELANPYKGIIELTRIDEALEREISPQKYDPNNPEHSYRMMPDGKYHYYETGPAMCHPQGKYASNALDLVKNIQDNLMQKYHGKDLTEADMDDINENIGEIHWILSHSMPWGRGSAGISDAYVKSLYKSLGIQLSQPKEGISFDLEAFCTELDDYKKNYKNLYEREPKCVTQKASTIPTTVEGMRDAIINAKDIDELRCLRDGIKNMPSAIKKLYVQKEQELRSNLSPVQKSMVDFAKMSELESIDQFMARKFKLPIEKFKTIEDFQAHCQQMLDDMLQVDDNGKITKDFSGKNKETKIQRKAIMQDWYDYVTKENDAYTSSIVLMIMNGITSNLKPDEEILPPVLNKGVLARTVEEIQTELKKDPKAQVNFEKKYRMNLKNRYMSESKELDKNLNGWIIIPSKKHDPKNFEENVDKLKTLSHHNWCTSSYNARPYLSDGDFHVYMENGKPKLGVRFKDDEIQEIQGELNNSRIPVKHSNIAMKHIKNCKLSDIANEEVKELKRVKAKVAKFKAEKFPNGIENASAFEILEACGIKCRKDKDGSLIISHFAEPKDFCFADLGIDERSLLGRVKIIEGNVNLDDGFDTSWFANLEKVGGNVETGYESFGYHFPKLKEIGGNLIIQDNYTNSLYELRKVGGNLIIKSGVLIKEFVNLEEVVGDLNIRNTEIESLGILKKVGGNAELCTWLNDMGLLEEVGGDLDLIANRELYTLKNLRRVGGNLYLDESELHDLGQLEYVGGDVFSNDYLYISDFQNNNVVIEGNFDDDQYINIMDEDDALNEIAAELDNVEEQRQKRRPKQNFDDYSDIFPDELDLFNEDPLYDDWGGGRRRNRRNSWDY